MHNITSSHPEVFCKKGGLKNFTKFTAEIVFNKVTGLDSWTSLKSDPSMGVFQWILQKF